MYVKNPPLTIAIYGARYSAFDREGVVPPACYDSLPLRGFTGHHANS